MKRTSREGVLVVLAVLGLVASLLTDGPALAWMRQAGFENLKGYQSRDWWQVFRQTGSLLTWGMISAALALHATGLERSQRGRAILIAMLPLCAAALGGMGAEVVKMFSCRLRPEYAVPPEIWAWTSLAEQFPSTRGIGLASSHAATAFGGAWALAMILPRAGAVALFAAIGCGVTRVLAGAHYPSDVYAGALVGYACAWAVVKVAERKPGAPD